MAETSIEWTRGPDGTAGRTWNPTTGCDKVSPGCDSCYALTMAGRLKAMGQPKYQLDGDPRTSGPGFGLTEHPGTLDDPRRWTKGRFIFVNSMSDLFHKEVSDEFICKVWTVMAACPQHTFQILTKRPQRMAELVGRIAWRTPTTAERAAGAHGYQAYLYDGTAAENQTHMGGVAPLRNVWLGVSIENDRYTFRADHLRATPAAVRWISAEPLVGPLTSLDLTSIDWVVVGGESAQPGQAPRPMHPEWARGIERLCDARHEPCEIPDIPLPHSVAVPGGGRACACEYRDPVPFFFKQWGAWRATGQDGTEGDATHILNVIDGRLEKISEGTIVHHPWAGVRRQPKNAPGHDLLDGQTHHNYPTPKDPT